MYKMYISYMYNLCKYYFCIYKIATQIKKCNMDKYNIYFYALKKLVSNKI